MDLSKYSQRIMLELKSGSPEDMALKIVMQEGALRFQTAIVEALRDKGMHDAVAVVESVEFDA